MMKYEKPSIEIMILWENSKVACNVLNGSPEPVGGGKEDDFEDWL